MKKPVTVVDILDGYNEIAFKMRGEVINYSINLELEIESFIAHHFLPREDNNDREIERKRFIEVIFWDTQMGLTKKKLTLIKLIKSHHKKFLEKYPDIEADIGNIIAFRNKMAHWELDFTLKGMPDKVANKKVGFKSKKTTEIPHHTENEARTIIYSCHKYTNALYYWNDLPHTPEDER